jgi:hypothetical protein
MSKEMREHINKVKNFVHPLIEVHSPKDKDLDISLKHNQGDILYDFWKSDYENSYIGLSYWLEDNGYEIYKNGKYKGFDGILYEFWSDFAGENEEVYSSDGTSSDFFDWLLSNGYQIEKIS